MFRFYADGVLLGNAHHVQTPISFQIRPGDDWQIGVDCDLSLKTRPTPTPTAATTGSRTSLR